VSKNVAVFVDVANIFYAAKAAGVDIDYVTLLKSATAGRDFVRAYAYTGLDPENENQRQFHNFLARSGYKVISKDIRKYGDGRIKANLDIELVVDMMKTARNLDIAVVVSGDGDFAPAIRAVQETGVRVEVISFRGNTSSDLIEVADQFTDIAQVARVEKGSARSGRRVAAEGDLSMTEVPEKETEGAPRRRRTTRTRDERPVVAAAAAAGAEAEAEAGASNLIVLPGERLSRAPEGEAEAEAEAESEGEGYAASANGVETTEDGRRRRRRRGGRGRGRGRRPEDEALAGVVEPGDAPEEDEEFEAIVPAPAPHHAFGSVWDSQLGVSAASLPPTVDLGGSGLEDDEDYEEPEVPEYLLAERRQRGQRQGSSGRPAGRNRSAYQAALDRERYGRGTPQPSFGGGGGNRPDRGRDRGRQGRPQQGGGGRTMDRAPRVPDRAPVEARTSSQPWSEVPPEVEEMLRAELARKQPSPQVSPVELAPSAAPLEAMAEAASTEAEMTSAETKPKRATRARTTRKPAASVKSAASEASAEASAQPATEAPAEEAKPKRATRARTTRKAAEPAATAEAPSGDEPAEAPAKPTRRRRTTAKTEES
jgi:uncharacterized LabA/DUF88 family protein